MEHYHLTNCAIDVNLKKTINSAARKGFILGLLTSGTIMLLLYLQGKLDEAEENIETLKREKESRKYSRWCWDKETEETEE